LIKFRAILYSVLGALFLVCTILAFTSVGFPYSDDPVNPRLQRFRMIHLKRTEYSPANAQIFTANNVLIYPWDRNGIRTLEHTFGTHDLVYLSNDERCSDIYMCGFPHYRFDNRFVSLASHDAPPTVAPTNFTLVSRTTSNGVTKIEFDIVLRTLTMLSVTAMDGLTYLDSNIEMRKVQNGGREHLVSWFTFGVNRFETTRISIDFEVRHILRVITRFIDIISFQGTPETNIWANIGIITIDSTFDNVSKEVGFRNVVERMRDYTFSYVQQADSSFYQIGN
jgi:hypothetical protein